MHAVEEYIDKVNGVHPTHIRFIYEGEFDLPKEKEINIYRIFQETIHNTIKHAKATTLTIELKKQDNIILLSISDDGVGFDYDERAKNGTGAWLTKPAKPCGSTECKIQDRIRKRQRHKIFL